MDISTDERSRMYSKLSVTFQMTLQILIQVTDMNNNAPYFVDIPYSVNISEVVCLNNMLLLHSQLNVSRVYRMKQNRREQNVG